MDLPRASQEYAYITLANEPSPEDSVEVSVDGGMTWAPVATVGASAEVLLRGPDYRDDERGLLVSEKATDLWLRVRSDPESIARLATVVFLY